MYKFNFISLFYCTSNIMFILAQNMERTNCNNMGNATHSFVCTHINVCLHTRELLRKKSLVSCGFENNIQNICCPTPLLLESEINFSMKDPYKVTRDKCQEYAEARYANVTIPGLYPGAPSKIVRRIDCVKAEELIVGGNVTKEKEFPHMALIGYNARLEDVNWDCAGTLISDRYVLSAAHCSTGVHGEAKWVRLGERVLDSEIDGKNHRDFSISERIVHPEYKLPNIYNDIALYKLNSSVAFNAFIRPVCLHTSATLQVHVKNRAIITGWGITAADEPKSEVLLKATIGIFDDNACKSLYANNYAQLKDGFDDKSMLCAGNTVDFKGTCQGDSGGPIQIPTETRCMWSQIGITSYGSTFCGETPSIFTEVVHFIPWIQQIVWP